MPTRAVGPTRIGGATCETGLKIAVLLGSFVLMNLLPGLFKIAVDILLSALHQTMTFTKGRELDLGL